MVLVVASATLLVGVGGHNRLRVGSAAVVTSAPGGTTVSLDGVQVTVPAAWQITSGPVPVCTQDWRTSSILYVGRSGEDEQSCPPMTTVPEAHGHALDGAAIWVSRSKRLTGPGPTRRFHGVDVSVGTDTPAADRAALLASLAYDPTVADTPVQGCLNSSNNSPVPAAAPIDQTMILGTYRFEPPLASDHPRISAREIWTGNALLVCQRAPSRFLLARFAVEPEASRLAWILLSESSSPSGIVEDSTFAVFDARNGTHILSGGSTGSP